MLDLKNNQKSGERNKVLKVWKDCKIKHAVFSVPMCEIVGRYESFEDLVQDTLSSLRHAVTELNPDPRLSSKK